MKHIAWAFSDFQTLSDRCRFGTEPIGAAAGWEGMWGGLEVYGCGAGKTFSNSCGCGTGQPFDPHQTLVWAVNVVGSVFGLVVGKVYT